MAAPAARGALLALGVLAQHAAGTIFEDIRACRLEEIVAGTATAMGLRSTGLDFTWNDTLVWAGVKPASTRAQPPTVIDPVLRLTHIASAGNGGSSATDGEEMDTFGPLLGVNVTVETCRAQWTSAASADSARGISSQWIVDASASGGVSTEWLWLEGDAYPAGRVRVPVSALWSQLQQCTFAEFTHSAEHGAPRALRAGGAAADGSTAVAAAAAAILQRSGLAAAESAGAIGRDAAVGIAVSSAAAAAAAAAAQLGAGADASQLSTLVSAAAAGAWGSAAALQSAAQSYSDAVPSLQLADWQFWFAPSPSPAPLDFSTCLPGSVRVTAVEWRFPSTDFTILARLAVDESHTEWLARYARASDLQSRARHEVPHLFLSKVNGSYPYEMQPMENTTVPCSEETPCKGERRTAIPIRHPASWVEQPLGAKAAYTAGEYARVRLAEEERRAAAAAASDGDSAAAAGAPRPTVAPGDVHALLPTPGTPVPVEELEKLDFGARNPRGEIPAHVDPDAIVFTLAHWWPAYELIKGAPPLSSYIHRPGGESSRAALRFPERFLGRSWGIILYMLFALAMVLLVATVQCVINKDGKGGRGADKRSGARRGGASGGAGGGRAMARGRGPSNESGGSSSNSAGARSRDGSYIDAAQEADIAAAQGARR